MVDHEITLTMQRLKRFLLETIAGSAVFAIIAIAAILTSIPLKCCENNGIDPFIITGLKAAKYTVFTMDLILFVRYVYITGMKHWRAM